MKYFMKTPMLQPKSEFLLLALSLTLSGCGGGTGTGNPELSSTEDYSTSGAAAAAVGGALSGSSSSGTLASVSPKYRSAQPVFQSFYRSASSFLPEALASGACPTFKTTGFGCATSGTSMWLSYIGCSFLDSLAAWTGTQELVMSAGSSTASCGTFPDPAASGNLIRQFVTASGSTTPGTATLTTSFGTSVTVDHATSDLGNFNGDTLTPILHGGYGAEVVFNALGARSSLSIGERLIGRLNGNLVFDHTPTTASTPLTITESPGASTRTISGSMTVYHNVLKVIGNSTFNSVTHTDGCCYPTQGSITTSFSAGSVSPTQIGLNYFVGKSETLTFNGCGAATFVDVKGASSSVTLSHCI